MGNSTEVLATLETISRRYEDRTNEDKKQSNETKHHSHFHLVFIGVLYIYICTFTVPHHFLLSVLSFPYPTPLQFAVRGAAMADAPLCTIPFLILPCPLPPPPPPPITSHNITTGALIATVLHNIVCNVCT